MSDSNKKQCGECRNKKKYAAYAEKGEPGQILTPDEERIIAAKLGGIGPCGRAICCSTWLKNPCGFVINMKMIRSQGVAPTSTAVNGVCHHLKCCFTFEADNNQTKEEEEEQE